MKNFLIQLMLNIEEELMLDSISTGIDLVEIDRIRKSIERNANFLVRFFGNEEIDYFNQKSDKQKMQSIAANFAAKEAFSKALGTGVVGFSLKDVQTLRNQKGAPYFKLSGKAKEIANTLNMNFSVSLSHTDNYATAVVVSYINS